ncbi:SHQ1-domain-containing protein [Anaeromyces robustus]|uniref:Protein SHQ1 homolog n=1 Tax=Anaeromyces robustus TaxID=1754192 RepID=A0A1Y1XRH5_9FUNG|nr:SHQ1-domain-containing protein [Anaeromyces robustus]|eukprot:ORX88265.1 SHQ1-domain-containing protein [Anaeromyces robustus]
MITPSFHISQDENFINIIIKCPYIKAQNVEFFVEGNEFKFYIKPYYLRLNLPGKIVEDGREKATYNIKTSEVTVRIPKETPGEYFEDLNLLTNLMAKSKKDETKKHSLIEVLNSEGTLENQPRLSETDEIDWDMIQELPKAEDNDLLLNSHYGFDNKYTNLGRQLQEIGSDVVNRELAEVLDTSTPESRRALRLMQENEKFDDDYYMDNFINNEEIKYFLKYKPETWVVLKKIQKEKKEELTKLENKVSKMNSFFKFTEEENRMMTNLPNIEFNITNEKALYLGLVDLLFAYCYDYRTTEGESTVESPWTIVNLSSSLSCFDTFLTLKETLTACIRRSLCYPLYRNFDLSMKCIIDVYVLFKLGKIAILKALLHMKKLFESQESYYIYNRCWIDDYCIWVQRCSKKILKSLASELHVFKIPKKDIGFDLEECEMIAKEIDAIEEDE